MDADSTDDGIHVRNSYSKITMYMKEKQIKKPEHAPGAGTEGVAGSHISPDKNGCGRILPKRRKMSNLIALSY